MAAQAYNSNSFGELFDLELKTWCHGLSQVNERVEVAVLRNVIREFAPVLKEAIENHYLFDLIDVTRKLIHASRCRVTEKEIAFYILSHLPLPSELHDSQVKILKQATQNLEQSYRGANARLEKKWLADERKNLKNSKSHNSNIPKTSINSLDLSSLSFPNFK